MSYGTWAAGAFDGFGMIPDPAAVRSLRPAWPTPFAPLPHHIRALSYTGRPGTYGASENQAISLPQQGPSATGPNPTDSASAYETYLTTGLSLAAQWKSETSDPRRQVAVLQAKIANLQDLSKKTPALAGLYAMQIRKYQAELAAAQQQLSLREEGEAATRQWRGLGQAGVGVAVVLGIALVGLVGTAAVRQTRTNGKNWRKRK